MDIATVRNTPLMPMIAAPLDLGERIRKPIVTKRPFSRLTDGEQHPVTRSFVRWEEAALTDECDSGCKVMRRADKPEVTRTLHSKVYGCTHPAAR